MVTGLTQIERVRQHYSIYSLCSAGQLAECRAGVNDPRQSADLENSCGSAPICDTVWLSDRTAGFTFTFAFCVFAVVIGISHRALRDLLRVTDDRVKILSIGKINCV